MIEPKRSMKTHEKVTLVIVISVSIILLVATGVAYKDYQHRKSESAAKHVTQQKVADDNIARSKAKQAELRQADINRLVAICAAAQARYEALTAKQQLLEIRPDCTLHSVQ